MIDIYHFKGNLMIAFLAAHVLYSVRVYMETNRGVLYRDEDPEFFSPDPDPAQLKKNSGSGSDLKSK